MDTQRRLVKEYLLQHGSITPRQAMDPPISTMRLADHIHKLRRSGMEIETKMIHRTQGGRHYSYAEYRLAR